MATEKKLKPGDHAHDMGMRSYEGQDNEGHMSGSNQRHFNERKAQEARQKHIAEMKSLAQRETQIWQQVDQLIGGGSKSASVYDEATGYLEKLKQLADFQDTRNIFYKQVKVLAEKYSKRTSLMQRWRSRGWI